MRCHKHMEVVWWLTWSSPRRAHGAGVLKMDKDIARQVNISSVTERRDKERKKKIIASVQISLCFVFRSCLLLNTGKVPTARNTLLTQRQFLSLCSLTEVTPSWGESQEAAAKRRLFPRAQAPAFAQHIIESYIWLNQKIQNSLDVQHSMLSTWTQVQCSPHCQLQYSN